MINLLIVLSICVVLLIGVVAFMKWYKRLQFGTVLVREVTYAGIALCEVTIYEIQTEGGIYYVGLNGDVSELEMGDRVEFRLTTDSVLIRYIQNTRREPDGTVRQWESKRYYIKLLSYRVLESDTAPQGEKEA